MTSLSYAEILGLPTLFALCAYSARRLNNHNKKLNILMQAVQAQMRSELLREYHQHMKNGYIDDDDLQEWENQYQAYHQLGQNGVLDKRREELMELPSPERL